MLLCLIPVLLFMSDWKKSAGIKDGTPSFGFSIRIISLLRSINISAWLPAAATRSFRQRTVRTPTSADQEEQPINNGRYTDDDDAAISMTL